MEVGDFRGEVWRLVVGVRGVLAVHELGCHVRLTSLVNPIHLTSGFNPIVPRVLPSSPAFHFLAEGLNIPRYLPPCQRTRGW